MNGDSYRLATAKKAQRRNTDEPRTHPTAKGDAATKT